MATGKPYVVKIVEPDTELRTTEWVGRCIQLTCHTLGLEAKDACCHKVYVWSPPCHSRLSINRCDWDARCFHCFREVFPGLRLGLFKIIRSYINVAFAATAVNKCVCANAV